MTRRKNVHLGSVVAGATVLLLTACGETGRGQAGAAGGSTAPPSPATSTTTSAPAATSATSPATGAGEVEPATCGPVRLPTGVTHDLVADPTAGGRIGCTEAFTVFSEFARLPKSKLSEASLTDVALSNGWSCTIDDGETTAVYCVKGTVNGQREFAFHTRPPSG